MRITKIELAGTTRTGEDLPRAFATLTVRPSDENIDCEINTPGGDTKMTIPTDDIRMDWQSNGVTELARRRMAKRELWRERMAQCERLAELLDGDSTNWKAYDKIVEQMAKPE